MSDVQRDLSEEMQRGLPQTGSLEFGKGGGFLSRCAFFALLLLGQKAVKFDVEVNQTALDGFNFCQQSVVVLFRGKIQKCKHSSHTLVDLSLR